MSFWHENGVILLEKQPAPLSVRLFVRGFGMTILLIGLYLFISNIVNLAFGLRIINALVNGFLLSLSGYLLLRLSTVGIWAFALVFVSTLTQAIFTVINFEPTYSAKDENLFLPFLTPVILFLLFSLLFLSYFFLSRHAGRRAKMRYKFLISFCYIALTGLGLGAYYSQEFCVYSQISEPINVHFDPARPSLHVAFMASFAQWLPLLPCYNDGDLLFE